MKDVPIYEKKKLRINNQIDFFFTYFWPQGVTVILKVITARENILFID